MLDFLVHYGYWGLFAACFLAATVLPFGSEAVFAALLVAGLDVATCIIVGSLGSGMGGMTNYYLGRLGKIEWIEKYLRVKQEQIDRAVIQVNRYGGAYLAFFSFLPFVGDVIPVALGFLKANVWKVGASLFAGKTCRYIALVFLVDYVAHAIHLQ
ncbi:MAG: DedA family protein [Tannerellaceae bacterium]|jgi:membrane protein YqaA with SNARE-associated domain|nr:DedA family protein [Tannerellaceae bacterium]